ncbi:hypothetical protein IW261DRAFT_904792 [Armillaria novae-zelandiae]|uniref:Uncharacterized protein n=1 Tax=Armillaria novae-zelandiae TaxID=153914 RepID=A0AA39NSR9_9AGAR|nr:hypothetical protein IW261DRAFT_904792 [Armillaria novae-zelandiae]
MQILPLQLPLSAGLSSLLGRVVPFPMPLCRLSLQASCSFRLGPNCISDQNDLIPPKIVVKTNRSSVRITAFEIYIRVLDKISTCAPRNSLILYK